jgi:hypothetical protein
MPNVEELIKLLRKISGTVDIVHIDVDFGNGEVHWKSQVRDLQPEEYIPRKFKKKHPDSSASDIQ